MAAIKTFLLHSISTFFFSLIPIGLYYCNAEPTLEDPELLSSPSSNIFVSMTQSLDPIYDQVLSKEYPNRGAKIKAIYKGLHAATSEWHRPIIEGLKTFGGVEPESFWLTNKIYVKNADPSMVKYLMEQTSVKSVSLERIAQLTQGPVPPPTATPTTPSTTPTTPSTATPSTATPSTGPPTTPSTATPPQTTPPTTPTQTITPGDTLSQTTQTTDSPEENQVTGDIVTTTKRYSSSCPESDADEDIKQVGAPCVWPKTKGRGTLIAFIDTGGRVSHQSIKANYIGAAKNGWFDALEGKDNPFDSTGHGTGVISVACGVNGIGVAPEAKWMACRAGDENGFPQSALLKCGQFTLKPSDPKGSNANEEFAPDIVNNSWGIAITAQGFFKEIINGWRKAGIIPVFATGNAGPACNSTLYPSYKPDVIGVGSVDEDDKLARTSSRGPKPKPDGKVVPQIVAPGENINAAGGASDDQFVSQYGTSFACPHVSGGIALLLSTKPELTFKQVQELIFSTAETKLPPSGETQQCGPKPENQFPNDVYGYGRLNISAAYKKMRRMADE